MPESLPPLLDRGGRLRLGNAVAALILVEREGYLMQLRDERPDIWYPGHWGLFGGAVEPDEEPVAALARELREELEFELPPGRAEFFTSIEFDLAGMGIGKFFRHNYVVPMSRAELGRLIQHEGAAMRVFAGDDILREARVTPYDNFAVFLHHARNRIAGPA